MEEYPSINKEPAQEDMPDWWPEDRPPQHLKDGTAYRDKEGRWRDHRGLILNRKQRRRYGLK